MFLSRAIWGLSLLLTEYWRMLPMLATHLNRPEQLTCRRPTSTLMLLALTPVRPHLQFTFFGVAY